MSLFLDPMEALAKYYKLDKEASSGFHDYIPVYSHFFDPKRDSVKTVFEIGIGCVESGQMLNVNKLGYKTGNSLRMWRDYFQDANIYAIDIESKAMIENEPRIKTFVADQSNKEQLEAICSEIKEPLDIVIDDGSHQYLHQVASFAALEKYLAPQSIYCIEDVNEQNVPKFSSLEGFPEEIKKKLIEGYDAILFDRRRPPYYWADDILICFKKKT